MRVVVSDENIWPHLRDSAELAHRAVELTAVPFGDRARLLEGIGRADAYVGVHFDEECARAAGPGFAFLQVTAAGTDHVALGALPASVTVANAHGHGRSIAEHVLMVTLAARRHLLWRDAELRQGRWRTRMSDPTAPLFATLPGTVVGIIGLGHIGRAIARLSRAVGMVPIGVRRSARHRDTTDPDLAWSDGMAALDEMIEACDVLVVACPLTDETRGLVDAARLRRLGASGTLVNVGRGAVVDEAALYTALRDGTIASAALDVWTTQATSGTAPPSPHPFTELDNVIMTPHYSATADNTYQERAAEVVDNLLRFLDGVPPRNTLRGGVLS
ncbi:2-hydroxyacid dehydrogenase [Streptomyces corynorhini]|uniref:Hydroxyacid dehydrogenase n=1 Tax=Streptomyces corynorhini TaxID=2282652 RepID=A0A370BAL2_9ACTN|nr:2-hydroxyacid dehydrogenase [Streptomyces corynorhini]RDG37419.1 hydroxyacid dehydrogenase [Streptomyces corynorhini]